MSKTLALLAFLLLAGPAPADGFIVPTARELPLRGTWAVKDHIVRIEIDGQRARTEVRQTFVNLSPGEMEVSYLFPVPEGAMLKSFTLVVDGAAFEGRILPADQALAIYEEIVRTKRDPGLLTYAGRGLVRTRVFPIPAGGSRHVVVRYEELLPKDGGHVKLVYPLDTERFSARPIEVVEVSVDLRADAPIKAVYSPSHPIAIERISATRATAAWRDEQIVPDRDLTLYYATGDDDVGASLFTYFPAGAGAGHFLLLLSPGALEDESAAVGRNLVVVLDHSGSMKGGKIEQAKEALRYVLNSLGEKDRLNLVGFSSAARAPPRTAGWPSGSRWWSGSAAATCSSCLRSRMPWP